MTIKQTLPRKQLDQNRNAGRSEMITRKTCIFDPGKRNEKRARPFGSTRLDHIMVCGPKASGLHLGYALGEAGHLSRRGVAMKQAGLGTTHNFRLRISQRQGRRILVTRGDCLFDSAQVAADTTHTGAVNGGSPGGLAHTLLGLHGVGHGISWRLGSVRVAVYSDAL